MKKAHILVIRFSALGDVAMVVPAVDALAHTYPDVRITVLSREFARPLFEGLPSNVSFMSADLKGEHRGVRGLNALFRRLVAKRFTAVADLHDVLRSKYLRARFNLANYRVEHINKHRQEKHRLTASRNKQLEPLPTAFDNYADVFRRLGYPIGALTYKGCFDDNGEVMQRLPQGTPLIGIAPFAAHEGKIYPEPLMTQVIGRLSRKHPEARIFLFGGGERELEVLHRWGEQYSQCVVVVDHLKSLREELVLMSRLNVMVSMDSANMHLASLAGVKVVSVWGATHPYAGFMGYGQSTENAVQLDLPCRPCSIYGNKPCRRGDKACLNNIKPDAIIEKTEHILSVHTI